MDRALIISFVACICLRLAEHEPDVATANVHLHVFIDVMLLVDVILCALFTDWWTGMFACQEYATHDVMLDCCRKRRCL